MDPCYPDDEKRLAALYSCQILDTPTETEFDDVTRLVTGICHAPIALVSFVDRDRQWFKSEIGLGVKETGLDRSICAHALLQPGLFVVPDTTKDERTRNNPLVKYEPHVRFYAGALIESADGLPLGTLCVLDYEPRTLTPVQENSLSTLANHISQMLELRQQNRTIQTVSDKLEEQLKARRDMMGIVTHDLRSPLSSIQMAAEVIREEENRSKETIDECGDIIRDCVGQIRGLINDLTDVSEIELDRMHVCKAPSITRILISDAYQRNKGKALDHGVELHIDMAPDLPETVPADPYRIAQCLNNLITNALNHTPLGGRIELAAYREADRLFFAVKDTGPGISEADQKKLFNRFWQAKKGAHGGRGLGLTIVRGIVEAHHGSLSVDSAKGEGSTFKFWIPCNP